MGETTQTLSEERIAAYVRGELSADEHAEVEAAIDADPQWLAVVALLARDAGPESGLAPAPPTDDPSVAGGPTIERIEREHAARLRPGARLGRYRVEEPLGQGGMGMVYAAHDPELDRRVALKLLRGADPRGQARLLREARSLARLNDRHVITIHDVGTWEGRVFLAMELLEGQTLRAWRRDQPRSWREVVRVFVDAGRGLQAAHAAGLVHRDFKPSNVMLTDDGRVVVLDFGLAHAIDRVGSLPDTGPGPMEPHEADPQSHLTRTGQLIGTPAYMAPEQLDGEACGPATDQYSFCVALSEALHGALPASYTSRASSHPPATGRLPRRVIRLLEVGVAPDPVDRHPSMGDLVEALESVLRPRAPRVALAVLAGLGGAGLAWAIRDDPSAAPPSPCSRSAEALADTWNEAEADAVASALSATDRPWSDRVRDEVDRSLRSYASAWIAEHEATCRAARVDGVDSEAVLDLRMGCLDRRRRSLDALVEVLSHADVEVASRAVQAAQGLPPLAGCRDVETLRAPVPLPDDPEERARAEAIFDQIARVDALLLADRADEAVASSTQAVHDATRLGHAPTEADARLAAGWARSLEGDHRAAEEELRAALHAAETGRHDQSITVAWNRLAWVVGYKDSRFEEGRQLARHAEAWARRASDPLMHDLMRLRTLGWIEHDAGNAEASLAHFEAGVSAAERLPGDAPHRGQELALLLNGLGAAALAVADLPRASEAFARSTDLMAQTLGPDHPDVAKIRNNLASLLRAQGQAEEARRLLVLNLEVFDATYGGEHPLVGQALINLSVVELDLGHDDDARIHAERAIAVLRAAHGAEHPLVAKGYTTRGDALTQLGRPLEALADFEHALPLQVAALGPEHPDVGIIESNIASVYYDVGRFEESVERHERALEILGASLGDDHPNLALPLTSMGLARREQGRLEDALALFRRAEAIGDPAAQASARAHVGRVLLMQGQTDEAVSALEDAVSAYAEIEHDPGFSGDAHVTLAEALWARGDRQRARAEIRAAIADFEAGEDAESLRDARRWLREHEPPPAAP